MQDMDLRKAARASAVRRSTGGANAAMPLALLLLVFLVLYYFCLHISPIYYSKKIIIMLIKTFINRCCPFFNMGLQAMRERDLVGRVTRKKCLNLSLTTLSRTAWFSLSPFHNSFSSRKGSFDKWNSLYAGRTKLI